jgi:tetratricopeptide (TPR) repeat protein
MNKFILYTTICLSVICDTNAQDNKNTSPEDYFKSAETQVKIKKDLRQGLYDINRAIEIATNKDYKEKYEKFRLQTVIALEKWDTAYSYCKIMIRQDGADAEINHNCGLVCLKLGNRKDMREEGYDLLKRAANSERRFQEPLFFVSFGDCLSERMDYAEAIFWYSKAIMFVPVSKAEVLFKAYQGRGKAYTAQGKTQEALLDFEQANRHATKLPAPDQAQHAYNLGILLLESRNYATAIEQFKKAADLNPTLHDALAKRGQCAYELHECKDAIAHLTNAIELQGNSDYYYHRSQAYLADKQLELALKDMNMALRQSNLMPLYHYQHGFIQLKLKAYPFAIEGFTAAIRRHDALVKEPVPQAPILSKEDLAKVYAHLGWSKLQQSKVAKNATFAIAAKQDFDNALKINTKESLAMHGLVLADIYIKRDSNYLPALDKAIAQNPPFTKTLLERGVLLLEIDASRAVKDFNKVIDLITKQADEFSDIQDLNDAYRYRIQGYKQLSDWNALLKDVNGFLAKGDSNDLSLRAQAQYQLQGYEAALKDFNSCLEKHPDDAMSWYYKSRCLEALQDLIGCRQAAQKASEFNQKNVEIAAYLKKIMAHIQKARQKTEKPIIIWHSLTQLNFGNRQVTYGKGNDTHLELHGQIISQSNLTQLVFEVNNRAQNVTWNPLNDTTYAFGVRVRLGQEAHLSLSLKLTNESGDTIIQRSIFIESVKNCTKSKRGLILVIGNQHYMHSGNFAPLKNPINDAVAIAAGYERFGFDVMTLSDGTLHQIESKIDSLTERAKDYATICFYYSGHGTQSNGSNYLIPVDFKEENTLKFKAYNLQKLFNALSNLPVEEQPCQSIILIDACRDTVTLAGLRITESLPPNTIVGFAVDAGQTAEDIAANDPNHGRYAYHLLEHLGKAEAFESILKKVRAAVAAEAAKTAQKQTPVYQSSLERELRLGN